MESHLIYASLGLRPVLGHVGTTKHGWVVDRLERKSNDVSPQARNPKKKPKLPSPGFPSKFRLACGEIYGTGVRLEVCTSFRRSTPLVAFALNVEGCQKAERAKNLEVPVSMVSTVSAIELPNLSCEVWSK